MLVNKPTSLPYLIITLFFLVLTACTTTEHNKITLHDYHDATKIFKIVKVDDSGNEINNRLILEALQRDINKHSLYPSFYSRIDDLSQNVSGFDVFITNENSIKIQYLNGKLSPSGNHDLTAAVATLNVEIANDSSGLYKTVIVHSPTMLDITYASSFFTDIATLDTPNRLLQDIKHIFNKLELSMERLLYISGEIIVRNSDDDVFENFEHNLGLYSENSFQENGVTFGIFELKSNSRNVIIPLRIRIQPDTLGSVVKYEFDVKYYIKPDGTTSYNETEIDYLITTIKNIATTEDLDLPINHYRVNNTNLIGILEDPVMMSNYSKSLPINILKKSVTFQPRNKLPLLKK